MSDDEDWCDPPSYHEDCDRCGKVIYSIDDSHSEIDPKKDLFGILMIPVIVLGLMVGMVLMVFLMPFWMIKDLIFWLRDPEGYRESCPREYCDKCRPIVEKEKLKKSR